MKNWMGLVWDRRFMHDAGRSRPTDPDHRVYISRCIVDLFQRIPPALNVLDCSRVMVKGGPKGPGELKAFKRVLAGTNAVAMDAYAAGLIGPVPIESVPYIGMAQERGLGSYDPGTLRVKTAAS
jgi:uncharacterized protein (DUF362 family)